MNLMEKTLKLEKIKKENDHSEAKIDFLRRNIPKLINKISYYEDGVTQKLRSLEKIQEEMVIGDSCDSLFEMKAEEKEKISVTAKHQALKET